MKKIYLTIFICLASLLYSSLAWGQLSATVDRNQIALDETLNLSITKDGVSSISAADLLPINKDFRIMARNQSSNAQYSNGSMSSSFTMTMVLAPKRSGILEIPALAIGKEKTAPIKIKVVTQAQPKTRADSAPLYIETEISERTILVQSQVIFTLRIFWAVEANIAEPTDPVLKDALMERLNDATFNKVINGQSYTVFERKYAIFPQKSGVLEIPQIIVQATIPNRHARSYGLFGSRGKEVKLRSKGDTITVREKQPGYPVDAEWLPTDKLSLAEEWSQQPHELQLGESVTITIAMAAQGLLGSQLPPIELPETEGLKLYQGKPDVQNLVNASGITGVRQESIALIPIQAGKMELPEIRIPWWDKKAQKVMYATIPARQLLVKNASTTNGKTTSTPPAGNSEDLVVSPATSSPPAPGMLKFNKQLLGLCVFLLLAWLVTIAMFMRTRRQMLTLVGTDRLKSEAGEDINAGQVFRKFVRACRSNDPVRARKTVIAWARAQCPEESIQTAADLDRVFPNSNLAILLDEIDEGLYSRDGGAGGWSGKSLLAVVEKIRKTAGKRKSNDSALQKLYK